MSSGVLTVDEKLRPQVRRVRHFLSLHQAGALSDAVSPAKDAGVAQEGSGSHRLAIVGDAGPCTDPDGFAWEAKVTAKT